MINIKVGGKDLKSIPITQNAIGEIIAKSANRYGELWAITIDKFDTARAPNGYRRLQDASHRYSTIDKGFEFDSAAPNIKPPLTRLQLAYDFVAKEDDRITLDKNVKVRATTKTALFADYIDSNGVTWELVFEHLGALSNSGSIVKAGNTLAKVGSDKHIHVYVLRNGKQYDLKNFLLKTPTDRNMEYSLQTAIRQAPGTKSTRTDWIYPGTVLKVLEGPRKAEGYDWYNVQDKSGNHGWAIAGGWTSKAVTDLDDNDPNKKNIAPVEKKVEVKKQEKKKVEDNSKKTEEEQTPIKDEITEKVEKEDEKKDSESEVWTQGKDPNTIKKNKLSMTEVMENLTKYIGAVDGVSSKRFTLVAILIAGLYYGASQGFIDSSLASILATVGVGVYTVSQTVEDILKR